MTCIPWPLAPFFIFRANKPNYWWSKRELSSTSPLVNTSLAFHREMSFDFRSGFLKTQWHPSHCLKFKSYLNLEKKESREVFKASHDEIILDKNVINASVAYKDIFEGVYFPAISLYKCCMVSNKFELWFKYPPTSHSPSCEWHDWGVVVEHSLDDVLRHMGTEVDVRQISLKLWLGSSFFSNIAFLGKNAEYIFF